MKTQASLAAAAALFTSVASAVDMISIDGSNFVNNATGDRFDIIGVTYQPGGSSGFTGKADPLSDADACLRDAILLQQLGANTIRVYNLSPDLNHDECVSIFNSAGIYMILDVNSGQSGEYIDRSDPSSTYTKSYLEHVFKMMEAFWDYPNLLGFFAGNEILNEDSAKEAPAYIRAVVRDMKEYLDLHGPRTIGVGYSAADVATLLQPTWAYLGCTLENSTYSKMDFFGLNDYEWCGDSSFEKSGYSTLVSDFSGTDIPVFFSEYGCNLVYPRTFTNVPVLYGSDMTELSGGLVYEYTQESDNYGLVAINSTKEVTLMKDFDNLKQQIAKIDKSVITSANKTAETAPTTSCDASLISEATFLSQWDLPERPDGADDIVSKGVDGAKTGSISSVSATSMPATVYDATGSKVTGLALNADSAGTASSASGSSTSSSKSSAAPVVGVDYKALGMVATVLAAFVGGIMAL